MVAVVSGGCPQMVVSVPKEADQERANILIRAVAFLALAIFSAFSKLASNIALFFSKDVQNLTPNQPIEDQSQYEVPCTAVGILKPEVEIENIQEHFTQLQIARDQTCVERHGVKIHPAFLKDCDRLKEVLFINGSSFAQKFAKDVAHLKEMDAQREDLSRQLLENETPELQEKYEKLDEKITELEIALKECFEKSFLTTMMAELPGHQEMIGPISTAFSQNSGIALAQVIREVARENYHGDLAQRGDGPKAQTTYRLTFPKTGPVKAILEVRSEGEYSMIGLEGEKGLRVLDRPIAYVGKATYSFNESGKVKLETGATMRPKPVV